MATQLCIGCMRRVAPGEQVCPVCGQRHGVDDGDILALRPGTVLMNMFLVGKVIGRGGFGITYVGFDTLLERKVAIKEYFPLGMVGRDNRTTVVWSQPTAGKSDRERGYESFLKEAKKMAKLESIPSVVGVKNVFIQNDTAYIVMDFIEGETLKSRLMKTGPMPFDACVKLLTPVIQAMEKVHQKGIIHRDISPDNMMLDPDGNIHLLDLGAAKDLDVQNVDGTVSSQLVAKQGFSPPEQYMDHGRIGSWTDVYAMCATIYYCVTGKMPPKSTDRTFEDTFAIQPPLTLEQFDILSRGMAIHPKNRIQTMGALLTELVKKEAPASISAPVIPAEKEPIVQPIPAAKTAKKRSASTAVAVIAVLLALCSLGYAWYSRKPKIEINAVAEPTTAATTVPTTEATTVPTTQAPTTEATTVPTTETPTTEATTVPTTEAPTTEAATVPITEAPTTEATTVPTTETPTQPVPAVYTMRRAETPDELKAMGNIVQNYWDAPFWGQTQILRSEVSHVVFQDTLKDAPKNAVDVSEQGDQTILAWMDSGTLHVAANGKITFNQDSSYLFYCFTNLESIDFGSCVDTSHVTDMSYMFRGCSQLTALELSGFNTSQVTKMCQMFCNCYKLTALDLSGFDTGNVTTMTSMFAQCIELTDLNLSGWDTSQVINMTSMFFNCCKLTTLDLSGFDISQVTDMRSMFQFCSKLSTLNLSTFDSSHITNPAEQMYTMFDACPGLWTLICDDPQIKQVYWRRN